MKIKYEIRFTNHQSPKTGSVLILAVVLTSLLAVVGVMFVMTAQVDRTATSAISENRDLNSAVEMVIRRLNATLVDDLFGDDNKMLNGEGDSTGDGDNDEYYDYPGSDDPWLASLEPYEDGGEYKWQQISDVTGYIKRKISGLKNEDEWEIRDVEVEIIEDHKEIELDEDGNIEDVLGSSDGGGQLADADGDGVADSKWIKLDNITSSKGKPVFAAIRVVDNSGMLNVNSAYKFDQTETNISRIDGSSQTQINIAALSQRGSNGSLGDAAQTLQDIRCGSESDDISLYEKNVIWRYNEPNENYTPFDISDELELRNRFFLNNQYIKVRLEDTDNDSLDFWTKAYNWGLEVPRNEDAHSIGEPNVWFWRVNNSSSNNEKYDYRHISTYYNMDRFIDATGKKMFNPNTDPNSQILYNTLINRIDDYPGDEQNRLKDEFAQIAANIQDYRDNNSRVTRVRDADGDFHYGFERPCIYISELYYWVLNPPVPNPRTYAIELYKPFFEDIDPNGWRLVIGSKPPIYIDSTVWYQGSRRFCVIIFQDPNFGAPQLDPDDIINDPFEPNDTDANQIYGYDPAIYGHDAVIAPYTSHFWKDDLIQLQRFVIETGDYITVDSVEVGGWLGDRIETPLAGQRQYGYQRDITLHKCLRRLWDENGDENLNPSLGSANNYIDTDTRKIQAHPANQAFTNVGEIGMLFRKDVYSQNWNNVDNWNNLTGDELEREVRCDLADPYLQEIFKYLTVWPPSYVSVSDANEVRIKGRININTAPWFVIAQLPWVSERKNGYNEKYELAKAIVAYRDMRNEPGFCPVDYSNRYTAIQNEIDSRFDADDIRNDADEDLGFASIGELNFVIGGNDEDYSMRYYELITGDLTDYPDLTPSDTADDDFEERNIIFSRISDLVTVRSDVFTAYILVRIGADGPQKRAIAILDRSNVDSPTDKVKVVAAHPVPDPR